MSRWAWNEYHIFFLSFSDNALALSVSNNIHLVPATCRLHNALSDSIHREHGVLDFPCLWIHIEQQNLCRPRFQLVPCSFIWCHMCSYPCFSRCWRAQYIINTIFFMPYLLSSLFVLITWIYATVLLLVKNCATRLSPNSLSRRSTCSEGVLFHQSLASIYF